MTSKQPQIDGIESALLVRAGGRILRPIGICEARISFSMELTIVILIGIVILVVAGNGTRQQAGAESRP